MGDGNEGQEENETRNRDGGYAMVKTSKRIDRKRLKENQ